MKFSVIFEICTEQVQLIHESLNLFSKLHNDYTAVSYVQKQDDMSNFTTHYSNTLRTTCSQSA